MAMPEFRYPLRYPDYAEALYLALRDDPYFVRLGLASGEPEAQKRAIIAYLDYSMREAREYGELYIPQAHRCGVSVWLKPLPPSQEAERKTAKSRFIREELGEHWESVYREIGQSMSRASSSLLDERAWYLSIIGVLPGRQGRGLGAGLVSEVLARTDALPAPTYLETFSPRNERFYERLGYRVKGSFYEPVVGASFSLMVREPAGA